MQINKTKLKVGVVTLLTALLFPWLAQANLEIKTEGECVAAAGVVCSVKVYKAKQGNFNQTIFCGDTYVYGDEETKKFVTTHVQAGHSLILTKSGQYKDGYCTQ